MKIPELEKLASALEEETHLVVWSEAGHMEVVAVKTERFEDAFPLPFHVQAAAAEGEMILDTTMAARIEVEKLPEDFWEGLEEVQYGENLRVSMVGRGGQKYLSLYRAVREGGEDLKVLEEMELTEGELFRVSRWMREESLFDQASGDVLMKVLTQLR